MAADSNLRATMNQGEAQRLADIDRDVGIGDLVNALINAMSNTETSVTVTTNVATLANKPAYLLDAKVSAGTSTGSKMILKVSNAYLTANNPAAGTCFWDGNTKVKFASADAATAAHFKYTQAGDSTCSYLQRALGQQDS